jgi:membrane protein YqaA with SNARE-associated domain
MPFGIDALVVFLASRYREIFWIFPPIVTAGSLAGVALTYAIGRAVGEAGLPRLVAPEHLDRIKARLQKAGAGTLAAAAVLPPPFPLTPFVLTCGALDLDRSRFFLVFGLMRLVRFGTVAFLARYYGERVLQVLESDTLRSSVMALVIVMCAAAIAAAVGLWRRAHLVAISA